MKGFVPRQGKGGAALVLGLALLGCGSGSGSPASASPAAPGPVSSLLLSSPDVVNGRLPADYTCDGTSSTLPLTWSQAPTGTRSFALIMHTVAVPATGPTEIHVYWVLYDIPPTATGLLKNQTDVGTWGVNSLNGQAAYAPPCSQGPGDKTYTLTLYALSAPPVIADPSVKVTRDVLLAAMQDRTLATATLDVIYARP